MLQPKFNLFFYAKFVFKNPEGKEAAPAAKIDFNVKGREEKMKIESELTPNSQAANSLLNKTTEVLIKRFPRFDARMGMEKVLNTLKVKCRNLLNNFDESLKKVTSQGQLNALILSLRTQIDEIKKSEIKKLEKELSKEREEIDRVVDKHNKLVAEFKRLGFDENIFNKYYKDVNWNPIKEITFADVGSFAQLGLGNEVIKIIEFEINYTKAKIKEYDDLIMKYNRLIDLLAKNYAVGEEIEKTPFYKKFKKKLGSVEDEYGDKIMRNVSMLKKEGWKIDNEALDNGIESSSYEIQLFENFLGNMPKYTISPKVSFDNSGKRPTLKVQLNGENIPKQLKEKIKTDLAGKFNSGFESKYASTASAGDTLSALIKAKLSSLAIPGRIEMDIKDENISGVKFEAKENKDAKEKKEAVVFGYASFDSAGNDYERNHKLFALGRAEKFAKQNGIAQFEGYVVGVNAKGESIAISDEAGVENSWKNLRDLYNGEFKKEGEKDKTVKELRDLVSKYNEGGAGFSAEQKTFFDKYLGNWRKSIIQYKIKTKKTNTEPEKIAYEVVKTDVTWA